MIFQIFYAVTQMQFRNLKPRNSKDLVSLIQCVMLIDKILLMEVFGEILLPKH